MLGKSSKDGKKLRVWYLFIHFIWILVVLNLGAVYKEKISLNSPKSTQELPQPLYTPLQPIFTSTNVGFQGMPTGTWKCAFCDRLPTINLKATLNKEKKHGQETKVTMDQNGSWTG